LLAEVCLKPFNCARRTVRTETIPHGHHYSPLLVTIALLYIWYLSSFCRVGFWIIFILVEQCMALATS